jgi:hypothetical protein
VKDKVNYKGLLLTQIAEVNLPLPDQYEYRFMDSRDWRFDYAWTDLKVAIEYNGIIYSRRGQNMQKTGHTTITGLANSYEKIGEAQLRNWIVLETNPILVRDYVTVEQLARAILKRRKSRVRYLESKKNV